MFNVEKPEIKFAQIEITTENEGLKKEYEVYCYGMTLFHNGKKMAEYETSNMSIDCLRNFFMKNMNSSFAEIIKTKAELEDFKAVGKELGLTGDGVTLFKPFDEGKNILAEDLTKDGVETFMEIYRLPFVFESKEATWLHAFNTKILHRIHYIGTQSDFEQVKEVLHAAAKDFRGRVLFMFTDIGSGDPEEICDFDDLGLVKADLPALRMIEVEYGDDFTIHVGRYKPDFKELTAESVKQFVQGVLVGKIRKHLLSQEPPEDWDKEPVKILTGKRFYQVANGNKSVFVDFYATYCPPCKRLEPYWNNLGEKYKDHPDIVIAKMEACLNELESIPVRRFPTLKLFPKAVEYQGARSVEAWSKFIDLTIQVKSENDGGKTDGNESNGGE